jgi:hypothetical protein
MDQTNKVFEVTPAEMRKSVFAWIGNGQTDESIMRTLQLFAAINSYEYVGATEDDTAFFVREADMDMPDGADYTLRPIAGLLVSVASVKNGPASLPATPAKAAPAKACGTGCKCTAKAEDDEAPSKPDRIKVLKSAIKQLNRRHLKPGKDAKHPLVIKEAKAELKVYRGVGKNYLAVLTSNPPKSVIGVEAKTLSDLQEALEQCLDSVIEGQQAPERVAEHMSMDNFRKALGL